MSIHFSPPPILILRTTSGPDNCYDKKSSCNVFPTKPPIHESEMFSDMKNTYVVISSFLVCYVPMVLFQLISLLFMTSSRIYDVITPVLMTSYDPIKVDTIQPTLFHDHVKFHLKWNIFQLLGSIPGSREFFNSSLQSHNTK